MGSIDRRVTKDETLTLENCPDCGRGVIVSDCGYSSFNPGISICEGCGRKWDLGYVDDNWHAGVIWNKVARRILKSLKTFELLTVKTESSISRDFSREELEEDAKRMLSDFRSLILGGKNI
jgi:hypothetical protein